MCFFKRLNFLIRISLCVIFFFNFISVVYATENNGVLYRVDTRSPDEIFANGFSSFGNNYSLRDHSRGRSCVGRDRNSAFISTSADPVYAGNYARRLYLHTNSPVYVYIITSSSNMYNMVQSLRNISYDAGIPDADTQSEWIAVNQIPASQISGVRAYTGAGTPGVQANPNFEHSQPIVNRTPYIENNTEDNINPIQALYVNTRPSITACMAATLFCFNSNNNSKAMNSQCGYSENVFTMTSKKKTAHFVETISSTSMIFPKHDYLHKWVDLDGRGNLSYCGFNTDANNDKKHITCLRNLGNFHFKTSTVFLNDYGWANGQDFTDANGDGKTDYCRLQYNWTHPVCSLSTLNKPFSENKEGPYINGGYDNTRNWTEDKTSLFCRQTSGTENICSDLTGKISTTFTDSDFGWTDSRMWIDIDNNGKSDYCRLVYNNTHLRCNLNKGNSWKNIETGYVDGGYSYLRFKVKMKYEHLNYCRVINNYNQMQCTEVKADNSIDDYIIALPFQIKSKSGIEFNDIDGDGFDDLCKYDVSNNKIQCYLNENKKFSSEPISLPLTGSPLVNLGGFSTKIIGARQSSNTKSAICYNVGYGSMRCDVYEIY